MKSASKVIKKPDVKTDVKVDPKAEIKAEIKVQPKVEPVITYTVCANVHMSRFLISGDKDGTSDPYVSIRIGNKTLNTSIKYDNINCVSSFSLYN